MPVEKISILHSLLACDSVCPHGAIDTIHGQYKIDENKCEHCKKCIAKFYNGCIICDKVAGKKE